MATLGPIWTDIPAQIGPAAARIGVVASRQHGVIRFDQLRAAGLSRSTIGEWARRGHLHRLYRGVYAVGHASISLEGRWLAAVLACGKGSVACNSCAARVLRLDRGRGVGALHVAVPRGSKPSPRGVLIHRPRALERRDLTQRFGIPTTTATRTLFDLCSIVTPRALRELFDRAAYLEVLERARLANLLDGARGRRGLGTLRSLLAERPIPLSETRSHLERIILKLCREHGIPIPAVNVPLLGYEVDFLWPQARFLVEADGGQHVGKQRDRDNERDLVHTRAGYLVRRYSSAALADESAIGQEVLRILAERLPRGQAHS